MLALYTFLDRSFGKEILVHLLDCQGVLHPAADGIADQKAGQAVAVDEHDRRAKSPSRHAVLAAAGGTIETVEGKPFRYGKPGFENPHFVAFGRRPAAGQ